MKVHFDIASRWQLIEILDRLDSLQAILADACTERELYELLIGLDAVRSPLLSALKQKWQEAYSAYVEKCADIDKLTAAVLYPPPRKPND